METLLKVHYTTFQRLTITMIKDIKVSNPCILFILEDGLEDSSSLVNLPSILKPYCKMSKKRKLTGTGSNESC